MATLPVTNFKTTLAAGLAAGGSETTISLASVTTTDGHALVTADIGDLGFVVINPNGSTMEICSFTGISGTTLTGVTRGLAFYGSSYSAVTANKYAHGAGETVTISDNHHLFQRIRDYIDGVSVAGAADASTSAKGVVEEATAAEITADTAAGGTSARLFVNPSTLVSSKYGRGLNYYSYAADSVGTDAYAITPSPAATAYTAGDVYVFKAGTANTGACTLNVNSLGAKAIKKNVLQSLETGDILVNQIVSVVYDGTNFQLLSEPGNTSWDNGGYDAEQLTQNTSSPVGEADTTGLRNDLAQSFVAGWRKIMGVSLYKSADTGSFSGTVTISIQADSAGSPSGSALATVTITNAAWLLMPTGRFEAGFSSQYDLLSVGQTYWIVIETSTSDTSNHPNIGANSAGGLSNGSVKYKNTTDSWVAVPTIDLYFQTLVGWNTAIPTTDSNGVVPAAARSYSFVDLDATSSSLDNSSTETTVYTKVLPAGFFKATSGFKIRIGGSLGFRANSNSIHTVRVKINGTTVDSFASSNGTEAAAIDGILDLELICMNTSISTQETALFGKLFNASGSSDDPSTGTGYDVRICTEASSGTASITTSGVCVLTVTFQNGETQVGTSWSYGFLTLEKIG